MGCVCVCGLPGKDSNSSLAPSADRWAGRQADRQTSNFSASQRGGKRGQQVWFGNGSALTLARWVL